VSYCATVRTVQLRLGTWKSEAATCAQAGPACRDVPADLELMSNRYNSAHNVIA
jgi:hypothetical protein